jgi:hypothetical protein
MYEHSTVKVTRRGLWPSLGKWLTPKKKKREK